MCGNEPTPDHRSYNSEDLEALRFLARAKTLGLTLPEISELLTLLAEEECRPVQTRLRQPVTDRITQAQDQIAELDLLGAEPPNFVTSFHAAIPSRAPVM